VFSLLEGELSGSFCSSGMSALRIPQDFHAKGYRRESVRLCSFDVPDWVKQLSGIQEVVECGDCG
jgi:hypothetical protein